MSRLTEALSDVRPGDRVTARAVDGERIRGPVARVTREGGPVVELDTDGDAFRLAARSEVGRAPEVERLEGSEWVSYGELIAIESIEREHSPR